jgi:hypothetical protein
VYPHLTMITSHQQMANHHNSNIGFIYSTNNSASYCSSVPLDLHLGK